MKSPLFDITIADKKIKLEINRLAPQANASVLATFGKTVVLATVVMGKVDETKDYFPLSVEFIDKLYAGGQIKGGKWIKREGGPSDNSVLFGRIIDRSLRPLFPSNFKNEVQVVTTVLSNDKENDTVITAFLAASTAISISDIPFNGPVSAVRVSLDNNNQPIIIPTNEQLAQSKLDLLVCTNNVGVNMIEAGAKIVDNQTVLNAIKIAKEIGDQINKQIEEIQKQFGKSKVQIETKELSSQLISEIEQKILSDINEFLETGSETSHPLKEEIIIKKVTEVYKEKIESAEISETELKNIVYDLVKKHFRARNLAGTRFDKRQFDEIRPLNLEVGVLPCTHGSAIFQRGLTQALTITTLSSLAEKQFLQDSSGETTKRYFHYYSAPPFSIGEPGRMGRPGRREIGHGALAEKALLAVIPNEDEFPYTIYLTSEVLSQNGSSSMASTCGSTLSLMDAGVPIKDMVAGISIGLISDGLDKYVLLTDIMGIEDHDGDMGFKITGTANGITTIQLDIKITGLSLKIIEDTFTASTKARLFILEEMKKIIASPRSSLSSYAPKIKVVSLPEDKIGEVIGSGGKTIKALMEKYHVEIDIDDDGRASVCSSDLESIDKAVYEIESMIKEVQVGEEYDGIVKRVENYGAFVEFLPGREALLHVSEMSTGFVKSSQDLIKEGDRIKVKISGFNDNHQIKLSAPEFKTSNSSENQPNQENFPNRNHV